MEKLELKHLTPYLPYELKCLNEMEETYNTLKLKLDTPKEDCTIEHLLDYDFYKFKPILRPLSDLTKEEFGFITELEMDEYFISQFLDLDAESRFTLKLSKCFWDLLFKNHFDVFNLISQDLAIDINTL